VTEIADVASAVAPLASWESVAVALAGATLWSLPLPDGWRGWRQAAGMALVALVAAASAAHRGEVQALALASTQGLSGLCTSWVLVRAVARAGDAVLGRDRRAERSHRRAERPRRPRSSTARGS
jgi:hypothetical protein